MGRILEGHRSLRPDDVPRGPLLLDTTAFSIVLKGRSEDGPWRDLMLGHDLMISWVTFGEALAGALANNWGAVRMGHLESALASMTVIPGTIGVAREYAALVAAYGTSKSKNDLWIAATALARPQPLPLVTNDKDFNALAARDGRLILVKPEGI